MSTGRPYWISISNCPGSLDVTCTCRHHICLFQCLILLLVPDFQAANNGAVLVYGLTWSRSASRHLLTYLGNYSNQV